jgi:4-hydroxy-tetrahydrodipicolinate synthase
LPSDTWRGIFPAICTPFTADDAIDLDAQRQVVRFVLEAGAHGIVAFGLAGEVLKLSTDERKALIDAILDEVGGAVPVFIGAGGPSIGAAIELARYAEQAGASCVVLPAPMSGALDEPTLIDYFVRVASSVSLPVMIQDAPAYLGVKLGPRLVGRVSATAENVRLVKLEAGPVEIGEWIASLGPEFSIWGGDGGVYLLDCMRTGAAGIIPGSDLTDFLVQVYEAEEEGDSARADELFRAVLPMLIFEMQSSIDHYNACAKVVLVRRGVLTSPGLRPPAAAFGGVSELLLEQHLARLDLAGEGARVVD